MKTYKAGLIGCGDYLRWLIDDFNNSEQFKVKSTFDLDAQKSEFRAKQLHASAVKSDDAIFSDPEIEIVVIFTPPFTRKELFEKAVAAQKHIITTKPLAPTYLEAKELAQIVKNKVKCAVFYGRTGNAGVEKLKEIFSSGEIGKLALYKEDWFHHYPEWNTWATDPDKNGGPFMDAMIHNLNKVRYLMDTPLVSFNFFSDNHAQKLRCNDTEMLKVNFEDNKAAHLFITWAGDYDVYDKTGNDREHIGPLYMITDKGWVVDEVETDTEHYIEARKNGNKKRWDITPLPCTPYDTFAKSVAEDKTPEFDISDAVTDIQIIHQAMQNQTKPTTI